MFTNKINSTLLFLQYFIRELQLYWINEYSVLKLSKVAVCCYYFNGGSSRHVRFLWSSFDKDILPNPKWVLLSPKIFLHCTCLPRFPLQVSLKWSPRQSHGRPRSLVPNGGHTHTLWTSSSLLYVRAPTILCFWFLFFTSDEVHTNVFKQ